MNRQRGFAWGFWASSPSYNGFYVIWVRCWALKRINNTSTRLDAPVIYFCTSAVSVCFGTWGCANCCEVWHDKWSILGTGAAPNGWHRRNTVTNRRSYLYKMVTGSPTVLRCLATRCTWGCCVLPARTPTHSCIGSCPPCCTASHEWFRLEWGQGCRTYGWAGLEHRGESTKSHLEWNLLLLIGGICFNSISLIVNLYCIVNIDQYERHKMSKLCTFPETYKYVTVWYLDVWLTFFNQCHPIWCCQFLDDTTLQWGQLQAAHRITRPK